MVGRLGGPSLHGSVPVVRSTRVRLGEEDPKLVEAREGLDGQQSMCAAYLDTDGMVAAFREVAHVHLLVRLDVGQPCVATGTR